MSIAPATLAPDDAPDSAPSSARPSVDAKPTPTPEERILAILKRSIRATTPKEAGLSPADDGATSPARPFENYAWLGVRKSGWLTLGIAFALACLLTLASFTRWEYTVLACRAERDNRTFSSWDSWPLSSADRFAAHLVLVVLMYACSFYQLHSYWQRGLGPALSGLVHSDRALGPVLSPGSALVLMRPGALFALLFGVCYVVLIALAVNYAVEYDECTAWRVWLRVMLESIVFFAAAPVFGFATSFFWTIEALCAVTRVWTARVERRLGAFVLDVRGMCIETEAAAGDASADADADAAGAGGAEGKTELGQAPSRLPGRGADAEGGMGMGGMDVEAVRSVAGELRSLEWLVTSVGSSFVSVLGPALVVLLGFFAIEVYDAVEAVNDDRLELWNVLGPLVFLAIMLLLVVPIARVHSAGTALAKVLLKARCATFEEPAGPERSVFLRELDSLAALAERLPVGVKIADITVTYDKVKLFASTVVTVAVAVARLQAGSDTNPTTVGDA